MVDALKDGQAYSQQNQSSEQSSHRQVSHRGLVRTAAAVVGLSALLGWNADRVAQTTGDVAEGVASHGLSDPQGEQISQAREVLKSQGFKFGDARPSAIAKDPATGADGVILRRGALQDIDISGTVGVQTSKQPLVIRSGEPTMKGGSVSVEELKETGVDLGNVLMKEVWGGPDTLPQEGEKGTPEEWVEFTVKGKDGADRVLYAAQKFAQFNGEKMLEIPRPDGSKVQVPFIPVTNAQK